jgi:hypothetical protein
MFFSGNVAGCRSSGRIIKARIISVAIPFQASHSPQLTTGPKASTISSVRRRYRIFVLCGGISFRGYATESNRFPAGGRLRFQGHNRSAPNTKWSTATPKNTFPRVANTSGLGVGGPPAAHQLNSARLKKYRLPAINRLATVTRQSMPPILPAGAAMSRPAGKSPPPAIPRAFPTRVRQQQFRSDSGGRSTTLLYQQAVPRTFQPRAQTEWPGVQREELESLAVLPCLPILPAGEDCQHGLPSEREHCQRKCDSQQKDHCAGCRSLPPI